MPKVAQAAIPKLQDRSSLDSPKPDASRSDRTSRACLMRTACRKFGFVSRPCKIPGQSLDPNFYNALQVVVLKYTYINVQVKLDIRLPRSHPQSNSLGCSQNAYIEKNLTSASVGRQSSFDRVATSCRLIEFSDCSYHQQNIRTAFQCLGVDSQVSLQTKKWSL